MRNFFRYCFTKKKEFSISKLCYYILQVKEEEEEEGEITANNDLSIEDINNEVLSSKKDSYLDILCIT
jgi:hypothetical protein